MSKATHAPTTSVSRRSFLAAGAAAAAATSTAVNASVANVPSPELVRAVHKLNDAVARDGAVIARMAAIELAAEGRVSVPAAIIAAEIDPEIDPEVLHLYIGTRRDGTRYYTRRYWTEGGRRDLAKVVASYEAAINAAYSPEERAEIDRLDDLQSEAIGPERTEHEHAILAHTPRSTADLVVLAKLAEHQHNYGHQMQDDLPVLLATRILEMFGGRTFVALEKCADLPIEL